MAKRNKGGSRSARRAASMSAEKARRLQMENDGAVMMQILQLPVIQNAEVHDAERWFYSLYRSMVHELELRGEEPTQFVEHRPSRIVHDNDPRFTWCRQCIWRQNVQEDSMGKFCECAIRFDEFGNHIYCVHNDGCTTGIRDERYRK